MEFTLLSDLKQHDVNTIVRVCVMRKWNYRGISDNGPVQHVDMVLADEKGNAIYAEIPNNLVAEKSPLIQVNKIYEIQRFKILPARSLYKPVEANFMIQFTVYTQAHIARNPPTTFPSYIYKLTNFDQISNVVGRTENFIDVLGIITDVQPLKQASQTNKSHIRDITIKDSSDATLRITLWGQRAKDFSINNVYNEEDAKPIVTLFVGCLAKNFQGNPYLSGSTACHWYFNPDIPEAETYYNRLQDVRLEVQQPTPQQDQIEINEPAILEQQSLQYLQTIDPFLHTSSMWQCTVTITRIQELNSWWFPSCYNCGKSCSQQSSMNQCSKCGCTKITFRYKLTFYATDGTAKAEMFCFDSVARQIVGKPCEFLIRSMDVSTSTPSDLCAIIGLKFTFAINININSYYSREKIFNVNSIIKAHGRQEAISDVHENVHREDPLKPDEPSLPLLTQESPATAMQRLSTTAKTSLTPRSLTYSPAKDDYLSPTPKTEHFDAADWKKTCEKKTSGSKTSTSDHESPPKRFKSYAQQKQDVHNKKS